MVNFPPTFDFTVLKPLLLSSIYYKNGGILDTKLIVLDTLKSVPSLAYVTCPNKLMTLSQIRIL